MNLRITTESEIIKYKNGLTRKHDPICDVCKRAGVYPMASWESDDDPYITANICYACTIGALIQMKNKMEWQKNIDRMGNLIREDIDRAVISAVLKEANTCTREEE